MDTVRDRDGNRYLLLKRSSSASLVRDPETGDERYVRNDRLERVDGASALETAADGVDDAVVRLVRAVHDDETLGLLIELADGGPVAVRTLLERYDLCESDLHGRITECRAAGLLEEADVAGERGYRVTDDCVRALGVIRGDEPDAG